jgi:G3E family GTPase
MLTRSEFLERQIACADVILLNKVDLAAEQEVLSVESRIHRINPVAPIYRTVKGQIDLKLVLGIGAYRLPPEFRTPPSNEQNKSPSEMHTHVHSITNVRLSCPTLNSCAFGRLDEWIRTILWEGRLPYDVGDKPLQVLRCKGYFQMESGEEYILQGVRNMYELCKMDPQNLPNSGKLVLIGKGLDDKVRQSFERIFQVDS